MSEYHAVCPVCARIVTRHQEGEAENIASGHNDDRHSGDDVARVVGDSTDDLNEFIDYVREEFDADVRDELIATVLDVDPWGVSDV